MIFIKINSMYINQLQVIHDLQIAYKTTSRYSSSSITCKQLEKLLPSLTSSPSSWNKAVYPQMEIIAKQWWVQAIKLIIVEVFCRYWIEQNIRCSSNDFFLKIARIFFYRIPHAYRSMVKIFGSPIPLGGVTRNYWQTIRKKSICRGDWFIGIF